MFALHVQEPANYALPPEMWQSAQDALNLQMRLLRESLASDFPEIKTELLKGEGGIWQEGLRRLLAAAENATRSFGAILMDDTSRLTRKPVDGEETSYRAKGQIDFFGEEAFTRVGGAGGLVRTVRAYRFSLSLAA